MQLLLQRLAGLLLAMALRLLLLLSFLPFHQLVLQQWSWLPMLLLRLPLLARLCSSPLDLMMLIHEKPEQVVKSNLAWLLLGGLWQLTCMYHAATAPKLQQQCQDACAVCNVKGNGSHCRRVLAGRPSGIC